MPTFHKRVENNTIIIGVEVAIAEGQPGRRFGAKVDTGATVTGITGGLVNTIGAEPVGTGSFTPANGIPEEANIYGLHVAVPVDTEPVFLVGGHLTVVELPEEYQPDDHDVLLGMDLLQQFHITMWNGNFIMSN